MKHYQTRLLDCEILVAGGGPAGVPCAIAAARQGAKVILCHDRPALGGNAGSEVRMHIVGANGMQHGQDLVVEARETGIIEEIRLENCVRNPQRSPAMFDLILYEKCRAEPNLTLYLNTRVVDVSVAGTRITDALAVRDSTEDLFRIDARIFVDCTGDSGLGAAAGAAFFHGREDRAAYGESMAQETPDRKTLGSTLLFTARKHPQPMPFHAPPWARRFTESDFALRPLIRPGSEFGLEYGHWWIEWGGHLDTIKDNEEIRDELLRIVLGVWDHVKNGANHGAENWALEWFGFLPGKRESRRYVGRHVLTQQDVMESHPQPDAIAYGGWPIDLHPPEGVDRPDEHPCVQTPVPRLYDIPLRSCVARDFDNLLFAGRNLSATHVAFASTRVMATCAVVGEGLGVAAAVALENGIPPADLPDHPLLMQEIRSRLVAEDVFLIDDHSRHPLDLASSARITASSEVPGGEAQLVVSGQNRAVHGEKGVAAGRHLPGANRWISEPGLPAWIELRWPQAMEISEIRVVFDTGLHRLMTFTLSDEYVKKMVWGTGQPETVRDFDVSIDAGTGWQKVTQVRGHWQRGWRLTPDSPLRLHALRLQILSTWGLDHARVMDITVLATPPTPG